LTDEKYERYIKRIKRYAHKFTEEEMKSTYLDGFGKMTNSPRIMRLVTLAYYRGMMRGVGMVKEGETPVVLD
jgi:hypothetical protein